MIYRQFDKQHFRIKFRRGPGWTVKECAEQIDGKVFEFQYSDLRDDDRHRYPGEIEWAPLPDQGYPSDAPIWIASGDLEEIDAGARGGE